MVHPSKAPPASAAVLLALTLVGAVVALPEAALAQGHGGHGSFGGHGTYGGHGSFGGRGGFYGHGYYGHHRHTFHGAPLAAGLMGGLALGSLAAHGHYYGGYDYGPAHGYEYGY